MPNLLTIILAAGKGTRMKSDQTKVLHQVAGKPMIQHVLDNVKNISSRTVVIVGYQSQAVKNQLKDSEAKFAVQKEQLGTGHAVLQARDFIAEHKGPVLVLYGDTPLLSENTLSTLTKAHLEEKAAVSVLTAILDNPTGYGRIIRNEEEYITEIIEEKDATFEQKINNEVNTGVYCFNSEMLLKGLDSLDNNNSQNEYYLTDTISYINKKKKKIIPLIVEDSSEIIGINDRINLAKAEKILRKRTNLKHMSNGVTIIDPASTYIDSEVEIDHDTIIYPFTFLQGNCQVGPNCVIGPHCRIVDSNIGNNVKLKDHSIIIKSSLADNINVGPFAYIRPGCHIKDEAKIGDFVELKKASIGKGTKVPHLSYVGDAELGSGTNIGAGTITANYDGSEKHRTIIGNNVFIGSNTTLVAPVKVENDGKTGAGAVVTKDVAENTTVVGVPARIFAKKKGGKAKS